MTEPIPNRKPCTTRRLVSGFFTSSLGLWANVSMCAVCLSGFSAAPAPSEGSEAVPAATPREFFNAGTRKLQEHQLREAEALFESTLASQEERLQPPALFNLGHVRFGQGLEELKKGPPAGPTAARAQAAVRRAQDAGRWADEALATNDMAQLVASYRRGRGARQELKAATAVVRRALQALGATLTKWQRAAGDFQSALELNRADADARYNAELVDRHIARLVDSVREFQQLASAMGEKDRDLGQKLKQLKGRIPASAMPPGAEGDEDEEDHPPGPQPGQKEGPTRQGQEMILSPEEASWLLDAFRLDIERRLSMGLGPPAEPRDRRGRDW